MPLYGAAPGPRPDPKLENTDKFDDDSALPEGFIDFVALHAAEPEIPGTASW